MPNNRARQQTPVRLASRRCTQQRSHIGFTLVELLVALFVMALLSVMSWRGIDGMARSQAQTQTRADGVLALQNGLAQWSADLDALAGEQPGALQWRANALRIIRMASAAEQSGLQVVAWGRHEVKGQYQWLRWQSPVLRNRADLEQALDQAQRWAENPGTDQRQQAVAIAPLDAWQVFYYRANAWTHPESSSDASSTNPDGIRLELSLPAQAALAGKITSDWVRPTLGGNKS
jgi:general secretion pathway protein J